MRESSLVPTNLLDWPRCNNLLPDQRLILLWLWSSPWLSCAGAGSIPLRSAAATLGLSPDALAGGLADLVKLKLINMDYETGELFILDWFRFHKFKTPVSQRSLVAAIKKIQSDALKSEISIKSAGCFPTPTSRETSREGRVAPGVSQDNSLKSEISIKSAGCSPTSTSTATATKTKDQHSFPREGRPDLGVSQEGGGIPAEIIGCAPGDVALDQTHRAPPPPRGEAKERQRLSAAAIAKLASDNPGFSLNALKQLANRLQVESEATL